MLNFISIGDRIFRDKRFQDNSSVLSTFLISSPSAFRYHRATSNPAQYVGGTNPEFTTQASSHKRRASCAGLSEPRETDSDQPRVSRPHRLRDDSLPSAARHHFTSAHPKFWSIRFLRVKPPTGQRQAHRIGVANPEPAEILGYQLYLHTFTTQIGIIVVLLSEKVSSVQRRLFHDRQNFYAVPTLNVPNKTFFYLLMSALEALAPYLRSTTLYW